MELLLDHNQLKGTIPPEVGAMTRLEAFSVSNNSITGSLPDIWDKMPNLGACGCCRRYSRALQCVHWKTHGCFICFSSSSVDFHVNGNHIRGSIPVTLSALTDLGKIIDGMMYACVQ